MRANINTLLSKDPAETRFTSHMGRKNLDPKNFRETLHFQRVKLDDEKCDSGGYSWANAVETGKLYCAFNELGTVQLFINAPDRKQGKRKLYLIYGAKMFN